MRVSHFATIQVLVPPEDYSPAAATASSVRLKTVGMAQNINVDDNFGSRAENTIGTPLPVLVSGFQQTTIRLEKATIDGADFRNLGAFNPLWAHVGKTYESPVSLTNASPAVIDARTGKQMFPFMFILATRNRVSDSYNKSNITFDNQPAKPGDVKARSSSIGMYVCVLQSASISMSSNQAVIMDSVNAVARPISGSWLSEAMKDALRDNNGDNKVGMSEVLYDVMWGYSS